MKELRLNWQATDEWADASRNYERAQPGLGDELDAAIQEAFGLIQESPEQFPSQDGYSRRFVMRRFPYNIHYVLENDVILVVAIAHARRRPDYWRDRL